MTKLVQGLLTALLVLWAPACWGTAYFSRATGNWSATSTWSTAACGGAAAAAVPGAGDTAEICNAHTVTCSSAVSIGVGGAAGTAAITVDQGGTFTQASGCPLALTGDIQMKGGSTTNFGDNISFDSAAARKIATLASGSGVPQVTFNGAAYPNYSTFTTTGGGTNAVMFDGTNKAVNLSINNYKITNCGSSSAACVTNSGGAAAGQNFSLTNSIFISTGQILGSNSRADWTFNLSGVTVITSAATTAVSFTGTTAQSGGSRTISNLALYHTTLHHALLWVANVAVGTVANGACTTPGIVHVNTDLDFGNSGVKNINNACNIGVFDITANPMVTTAGNANQIHQYNVLYTHTANPHYYQESGNVTTAANQYTHNFCDGDNFYSSDAGDFVLSTAPAAITNNVLFNNCGTLWTANSAAAVITAKNNTEYCNFSGNTGETTGAATQLAVSRNNLFTIPAGAGTCAAGTYGSKSAGISMDGAFIRQTGASIDYNAFWGAPGSGDVAPCVGCQGARSANPPYIPLVHSVLGAASYMQFPTGNIFTSQTLNNTGSTTTPTNANCSTCNWIPGGGAAETDTKVGDYALCTAGCTGGVSTGARITAVVSGTRLTLASPGITGLTSGSVISIAKGYISGGTQYGSAAGFGASDLHVNPNFRAGTRTMTTWDTANGGAGTQANIENEVVKLNGFDKTGTAATFNAAYRVDSAISYFTFGFTPTNAALKAAGSPADGSPDIGALPVVSGARTRASVIWR